eukprot:1184254-Prorocentrum_minimum.AAC.10
MYGRRFFYGRWHVRVELYKRCAGGAEGVGLKGGLEGAKKGFRGGEEKRGRRGGEEGAKRGFRGGEESALRGLEGGLKVCGSSAHKPVGSVPEVEGFDWDRRCEARLADWLTG